MDSQSPTTQIGIVDVVLEPMEREVDRIISRARAEWAFDDQWIVTWEWVFAENTDSPSASQSDPSGWTQKHAHLKLDSRLAMDQARLTYEIYHELGHAIVAPIWRGMSDWADHKIKDPTGRAIWEEQVNTRENEVIDHVVCQIFGINHA